MHTKPTTSKKMSDNIMMFSNGRVMCGSEIKSMWRYARSDKRDDVAISWVERFHSLSWLSKDNMTEQMKLWRKSAKGEGEYADDRVRIFEYNNKEVEDMDGKKWYTFVVQTCGSSNKMKYMNLDAVALTVFNIMVGGYLYAFKSKVNRDRVYEYVMKDLPREPENEDGDDEEEEIEN